MFLLLAWLSLAITKTLDWACRSAVVHVALRYLTLTALDTKRVRTLCEGKCTFSLDGLSIQESFNFVKALHETATRLSVHPILP